MVARVRSIIDEVSTTNPFYSADEIYAALDAGQRQLIQHLVMVWTSRNKINGEELFETLKPLVNIFNTGTENSAFSLPTGFIKEIYVSMRPDSDTNSALRPCRKRTYDAKRDFKGGTFGNALLKTDGINSYFYQISGTQLVFDTYVDDTGAFEMAYLKYPTAIAVGQEPTLQDGHEAICQFACYSLFAKDRQMEMAIQCYGAYAQDLPNLYF